MKLLFSSVDLIAVSQLKDFLEDQGIPCLVKNEILTALWPEVPFADSFPELWVQNDADFEKAARIKADWKRPMDVRSPAWTCPHCAEELEPQFSSCWKCGTAKAEALIGYERPL
jgi:hypothetical protein